MKFEALQALSEGENPGDALHSDLSRQLDKLPVERFCHKGGWPLNVAIGTIAILENSDKILSVVLYVSFTQTGAACCSGDNFEHEHFEELPMIIDRRDWTFRFPASN